MPGQLSEAEKKRRAAALAAVQKESKAALLDEYVQAHRTVPVHVLVEEPEGNEWLGHTEHYAEVRFSAASPTVGSVLDVLLSETDGSICLGRVVE